MFLVVSHARFEVDGSPTHGTGSELTTFLQGKKAPYIFIWHSLFPGYASQVEIYKRGKVIRTFVGLRNLPLLVRVCQEQIINYYYIFRYSSRTRVFIGIDPLNSFSGIVARKLGFLRRVVFYTADYAIKRFENQFLNTAYHIVDKLCLKNSDEVWNVSSRIYKLRLKQGTNRFKNFFIPNTPEFSKVRKNFNKRRHNHDLVIVSNITKAINYPLIIRATGNLAKRFKNIRLLIIGTGEYQKDLEKLVGRLRLSERVIFLGRKKHDEVLDILSSSGIGIAIYTREYPWTEFGDSMKAREYLACGLPVIISDVVSTADDVKNYEAGFVLTKGAKNFEEVITSIFSDGKLYKKLRENAVLLARKYDFTRLMRQRLGRFI